MEATCGGILSDSEGRWILCFQHQLGHLNSTTEEIMSLLMGIQVCTQNQFQKVQIYTDSLEAIQLIQQSSDSSHPMRHEITQIRELLFADKEFQMYYASREVLKCVDYLAKEAHSMGMNRIVMTEPHPGCLPLMEAALNSTWVRLCLTGRFVFKFVKLATCTPKTKLVKVYQIYSHYEI